MQTAILETPIHADRDRHTDYTAPASPAWWDVKKTTAPDRAVGANDKFLPDGLTLVDQLDFMTETEKRFVSRIQGCTYAGVFGTVARFLSASTLASQTNQWTGNRLPGEISARFDTDKRKQRKLLERLASVAEETIPRGYRFVIDPKDFASVIDGKSTWAILAFKLHFILFAQLLYRESAAMDEDLSPLFKNVFLYHWVGESQNAAVVEKEWIRHDAALTPGERESAISDFVDLLEAFDQVLLAQVRQDARYFAVNSERKLGEETFKAVSAAFRKAYRWQYILSGADQSNFGAVLRSLVSEGQSARLQSALAAFR